MPSILNQHDKAPLLLITGYQATSTKGHQQKDTVSGILIPLAEC